MLRSTRRRTAWFGLVVSAATLSAPTVWAKPGLPTAEQALELRPVQKDIEFALPDTDKIAKCNVAMETVEGMKCYVVRSETGQVLRRFADTNSDTKVDTWCYFNDGIEVYRDIDSDGNGKADQYRWLGIAGTRWGIDRDEDSRIDSWKMISAEEVTEEVVAAIKTSDKERFSRVLISASELKSLPMPSERKAELQRLVDAAPGEFTTLVQKQKLLNSASKWASFGGGKPGVVPTFGENQQASLVVYDNAAAVVETAGKHSEVAIGTMVRVGDTWRVIDVPRNLLDDKTEVAAGFFFQAPLAKADDAPATPMDSIGPEMQRLVAELEKVDKELAAATSASQQSKLNVQRADLVERISGLAQGEDRATWIRQYAETVSAAVQGGTFPEGTRRLKALTAQLQKQSGQDDLVVYVGFRALQTDYNQSLATADGKESEIGKIREAWISGLEKLVADFGKSSEAAEPMLALAQECELEGKEEQAVRWYGRIATDFPESSFTAKAKGAKRRLEAPGKSFVLSGNTIDGKPFSSAATLGRTTVVYYWASWYDKLPDDFSDLRALQAKYAKAGFQVVSINLDSNRDDALKTLKKYNAAWPTLYEPGGFDSRYANEMGIFSLPVVVLVDKQGKVVTRSISVGELDGELKKLLK